MFGYVNDYLEAGWEVPIPLPPGKKYPPKAGMTGRIARVTKNDVENSWKNVSDEANVALRMQVRGKFDVIALDVDHYESKQGRTYLDDLMEELGDLNLDNIPRSTRRGPKSPSGQFFFKVPKGNEWESSACPDVDVVQMTHRYSAVWPSVVDGDQYRWYVGEEQADIPHVRELPTLPERWVNHLTRGKKGRTSSGKRQALGGYREALNWLRDNLSGWDVAVTDSSDPDITMSPYLRDSSTSEEFLDALENNAHDTMVEAVHKCVMAATEGHHGLKAALFYIGKAFVSEVVEDGRRGEKEAKDEFERAVTGEVEKLAADVEAGLVRILNITPDMAMPNFKQYLVPAEAEKRPLGVDWRVYGNTDQGHARMFRDYWERNVLVTDDNKNQEFAAWIEKNGRYSFRNVNQMFRFVEYAVSSPLDYEADKLEGTAQALKEKEADVQLEADDLDSDDYESMANNLRARANSLRNTRPAQTMLKQLHSFDDIAVNLDDFDTVPGIVGSKNGKTLDLNLLRKGESPVRDSLRTDMLTMSTKVSVQEGAQHDLWDEFLEKFLPDEEIRLFAQKVFGYTLVDHNPAKLLVFLWGPSNSGKSTMLEAVANALGDYSAPMAAYKVFGNSHSATNPELVNAIKKRMIILSEVGDGYKLSSNAIKQITGNDTMQARNNHSNHIVNAIPQFTPYVSTNNPPEITRGDAALKNRILVLPFDHAHAPQEILPEEDLKENKEIASAILWWLVEGCRMYLQEGLMRETWPAKVREVSDEFVSGTSSIQRFIGDRLEVDPKGRILEADVYREWKTWCSREGMDQREIGTKSELRSLLDSNGFKQVRNTSYDGKPNQTVIKGITLKK